jgi:hypothetical protein
MYRTIVLFLFLIPVWSVFCCIRETLLAGGILLELSVEDICNNV